MEVALMIPCYIDIFYPRTQEPQRPAGSGNM